MRLLLLLLVAIAACGDQVQKAKPPADGAAVAETAPAGPDPFAEAADAGKAPMKAPPKDADASKVIYAGVIDLDPAVKVGETYTVFVTTVYAPQDRIGVLIRKYETPKFPFTFELTAAHAVMGDGTFERPLYVRAMISDTGDAMKNRNRTTTERAYPAFTKDITLTIKP